MVENKETLSLLVEPSPHILNKSSTNKIMAIVLLAMSPTLLASTLIFGWRVLLLTAISVAACVGFEWLFNFSLKKPQSIGDLSACVTGVILAFNLPATLPWWMPIIGAFVAIVITKMLFGGIGYNFANPALVGRMALMISFPAQMTNYGFPKLAEGSADVLASATPLVGAKMAEIDLFTLLLGRHGGVLGETAAITLILGLLIMLFLKVVKPAIPAAYVGTVFVLKFLLSIFGGQLDVGSSALVAFRYVLSGGLLLGAIFMATDYSTSPYSTRGKVFFGLGLGVLTVLLREFARAPEGVSYALLIMSLLVPYINSWCRKRPFGAPFKPTIFFGKGEAK